MAEGTPKKARGLTDWLILIFVLVVMGLLIADLRTNVLDVVDDEKVARVFSS